MGHAGTMRRLGQHRRQRTAHRRPSGGRRLLAALAAVGTLVAVPVARPRAAPGCVGAAALASWPARRLAAQTVVVPVAESDVSAATGEVRLGAGGIVLFGSAAPPDLAQSLRKLTAVAPGGLAPLVMTDEEGGAVERLGNLVGHLPAARTLGATKTPAEIRAMATALGHRLRAVGVTMDLAPVADVDGGLGPNARDPDGTRSFSADPTRAAADAVAFARGLLAAGVVPVLKHFPGLGGASGNTDLRAATTLAWPREQRVGLPPFRAGIAAGLPAVMVANAVVPGLSTLPASISPAVVRHELRGVLGFRGLVLTDSLSAVAVRAAGYSVPSAAVAALAAGVDLVLYNPPAGSVARLTDAVLTAIVGALRTGTLTRSRLVAAASHVLAAKGALCGTAVGYSPVRHAAQKPASGSPIAASRPSSER